MGVAPSRELMREIDARERLVAKGGAMVVLPGVNDAVPANHRIAAEGLRTIPPREFGGNLDIKQLGPGTTLRLPVYVDGALFSTGDAHFAQGDGEACGTAIEMGATVYVKFGLRTGKAREGKIRDVQFYREGAGEAKKERPFFATTGQSHNPRGGPPCAEDLNMATRNALLNMIDYLASEHGLTRQQAYTICSVAVDLKISQIVDVPNYLVSAVLPLDIFV
jgi:formamidase